MLTADVADVLTPPNDGLLVIIAVGNPLRGDDGVGPYISSKIKAQNTNEAQNYNTKIINAEERPENIIDEVVALNPSRVIIIDSANFGGIPGEARIISEDEISDVVLSTHMFPLRAISKIIEEDTGAKVQQKTIEIGSKMSNEVVKIADEIIDIINGEK